jgi:excisionase family DNA binding protein
MTLEFQTNIDAEVGQPNSLASQLPHLFTLPEACEYLGLHERTLRGFISKGQVRASRIGRSFRFRKEDLLDALKPFKPDASANSDLDDFIEQQIGRKTGVRS